MPKLAKKVLTTHLFVYMRPANSSWIRAEAKKRGMGYSKLLDTMVDRARRKSASPSRQPRTKAA